MALLDTKAKSGIVVLSDYNELKALYVCQGNTTIEPMYRITYLPAGQSLEYQSFLVPVVGLDNILSATPSYIAGYSMKTDGKGSGELAVSAARSVGSPAPLSLRIDLSGIGKNAQTVTAGTLDFPALGDQPQTKTLNFKGAAEDPLILKVSDPSGSFEEYFNGSYKWGENIQTDMATPVYSGPRPAQKLTLRKPPRLALLPTKTLNVWYAEGLLDADYRLPDAIHIMRHEEKDLHQDTLAFTSYSGNWRTQLSSFPYDYEQLLSYAC